MKASFHQFSFGLPSFTCTDLRQLILSATKQPGPMRTWRKSVNILASTFPLFDVPWALLFLTNCIHCCRNFGHPMEVWKVVGLPPFHACLFPACLLSTFPLSRIAGRIIIIIISLYPSIYRPFHSTLPPPLSSLAAPLRWPLIEAASEKLSKAPTPPTATPRKQARARSHYSPSRQATNHQSR